MDPRNRLIDYRPFVVLALMLVIYGCGGSSAVRRASDGPPPVPKDVSNIPDAEPKYEPRSRYGNPKSYVVLGKRYYVMDSSHGYVERGIASWYGSKFHGRRTSSGESYDMYAMTAAHKSLPLPTYVRVKNLENGQEVVVKVNDRGPFHENRIIDLSYAAASKLDMLANGTALVEVRAVTQQKTREPDIQYVANMKKRQAAPTVRQFYIQVGAFSSLANAENLRIQLDSIENKFARIYQTVINNETLYRVRIGPLKNVKTADRIVARLHAYGIYEHQIVTE